MSGAAGGARAIRVVAGAEAVFGVACLAVPAVFESAAGVTVHRVDGRRFVQILGVRHLVQAALVAAHPTSGALRMGAAVDAIHATTMLGAAGVDAHQRRPLIANTAAALCWFAVEVIVARRTAAPHR